MRCQAGGGFGGPAGAGGGGGRIQKWSDALV